MQSAFHSDFSSYRLSCPSFSFRSRTIIFLVTNIPFAIDIPITTTTTFHYHYLTTTTLSITMTLPLSRLYQYPLFRYHDFTSITPFLYHHLTIAAIFITSNLPLRYIIGNATLESHNLGKWGITFLLMVKRVHGG